MTKKELHSVVLGLFSKSNAIALSYNEMCNELQLVKQDKTLLGELLTELVDAGELSKIKRKYRKVALVNVDSPTPSGPANLLEGTFDATPLARDYSYAFIRTPDKDYYISSEDTLNAYHDDVVAFEAKYRKGRNEYGIIRKIIKRANETMAGDISALGAGFIFTCSNPKIHKWFEVADIANAHPGDKVILRVSNWGDPIKSLPPAGKVIEVLGPSGDPQVELLAVLRQYGLPLEFPPEVAEAAQQLPSEITQEEVDQRHDLRKLFTFTVDPASAKDYDDAISLETLDHSWKLYVHIADVAHYVHFASPIFAEAAIRGNSFYFPKLVIPMLPETISNRLCSLRPEEDKLCLTVETEIDFKGKFIAQSIYESVIRSNYRLTYEDVDQLFDSQAKEKIISDPQMQNTLFEARKLSRLLTDRRMKAGYIFFDLPELEYQYDEAGFIHRLTLAEETESHKLIENFMLVANEYVAERLSSKAPATIYRIHEDPDYEKIARVLETLSFYGVKWVMHDNLNKSVQYLLASFPTPQFHQVFDRILLRSMKKAKYSTEHIRHFGLALQNYTHFTSPIRRLCDLVIHHLCKIYLIHSSQTKLGFEQIKHFAQVATDQELKADNAERDIERVYSRAFIKEKIGQVFTGMVISASTKGIVVRLNEIPVTGIVELRELGPGPWNYNDKALRYTNRRTGLYFQLMDQLKLVLTAVEDDIYFSFQDTPRVERHVVEMKEAGNNQIQDRRQDRTFNRNKAKNQTGDFHYKKSKKTNQKQSRRGKR